MDHIDQHTETCECDEQIIWFMQLEESLACLQQSVIRPCPAVILSRSQLHV
jgi:hypothetical protein